MLCDIMPVSHLVIEPFFISSYTKGLWLARHLKGDCWFMPSEIVQSGHFYWSVWYLRYCGLIRRYKADSIKIMGTIRIYNMYEISPCLFNQVHVVTSIFLTRASYLENTLSVFIYTHVKLDGWGLTKECHMQIDGKCALQPYVVKKSLSIKFIYTHVAFISLLSIGLPQFQRKCFQGL